MSSLLYWYNRRPMNKQRWEETVLLPKTLIFSSVYLCNPISLTFDSSKYLFCYDQILKYDRLTSSGCKDYIRKFKFVSKTQFLWGRCCWKKFQKFFLCSMNINVDLNLRKRKRKKKKHVTVYCKLCFCFW